MPAPSPPPARDDSDALAAAAQRRLDRLRFDLHDGPQQEVHVLAQEVRELREQLSGLIAEPRDRARALGRLDDLEAQLIAVDEDLRRLCTAARSPLVEESLADALAELVEAFAGRTGIVPSTEVSGDIESLTDSQQIAVLSLVREALANVRRHAEAERVEISLRAGETEITVEIRDDGRGFGVEADGARAARRGRLGLIGMHERMRMLGGRTEITSSPGGPTVVSAVLPRWPAAIEPSD